MGDYKKLSERLKEGQKLSEEERRRDQEERKRREEQERRNKKLEEEKERKRKVREEERRVYQENKEREEREEAERKRAEEAAKTAHEMSKIFWIAVILCVVIGGGWYLIASIKNWFPIIFIGIIVFSLLVGA